MPRILDLFCCAGGAGMGYHRAGFDVVGVDLYPQPNYPFPFHQGDALEFLLAHGHEFDAIHASPPCQAYSETQRLRGNDHPELIPPTREALMALGLPWIIENVTAAPSQSGIVLCGSMFGLPIQRHRTFESSHLLMLDRHCDHKPDAITVTGHSPQRWLGGARKPVAPEVYQAAMGIDWMLVRELVQAIPPDYTEYVGAQVLDLIREPAGREAWLDSPKS